MKVIFLILLFTGSLFSQELPKNIIILIGDGMGLSYVSANVITDPDSPFKRFESIGLSLTSSLDKLITDSGASATALATGYHTYNLAISVDTLHQPLTTILELAGNVDKSTGIIATSSVTHATPAAFIAHVPDRKMEDEIARQIYNSSVDVVIGGGAKFFSPAEKNGKQDKTVNLIDSIKNRNYNFFSNYDELVQGDKSHPFYALLE